MDVKEVSKVIQEVLEQILYFIGVVASVDIVSDVVEENLYHVDLSGNDLGLLIGYHGEGLSSLQNVLSLMVAKRFGSYVNLNVDVNGYRKEREEKIKEMTKNAVDKVKFTLKPIELPPMVAFERRLAHLEVSKFEDVTSESIGEGYNRRVIVRPGNGSSRRVDTQS